MRRPKSIFKLFAFAVIFADVAVQRNFNFDESLLRTNYDYDGKNGNPEASLEGTPSQQLKIALLMSFPNSGTSYTLQVTSRNTGTIFGSNYCHELTNPGGQVGIFDGFAPTPVTNGGQVSKYRWPTKYILTKTHCGGFCQSRTLCGPDQYLISNEQFQHDCLRACSRHKNSSSFVNNRKKNKSYSHKMVGKAVHLFRDPFDNIVSRFHHLMKKYRKTMTSEEFKNFNRKFNDTPSGFQAYCQDWDSLYGSEEELMIYGPLRSDIIHDVPCHAEFFLYTNWHNNAFKAIASWGVPSHILRYEDYHTDFNGTMGRMMGELEQEQVAHVFGYRNRDYSNYFSNEQRDAVQRFIKRFASHDTLNELRYYGV